MEGVRRFSRILYQGTYCSTDPLDSRIKYGGSRIKGSGIKGPGSRIQVQGSRIKGPGSKTQHMGSKIMVPESRIQDWLFGIQDSRLGSRI